MKFGMFLIGDSSPERSQNLKIYYDRMMEQVRWAETLGYECFWFGEHHFDFFGVIPSPPVIMSVAARCTDQIRIGVAGFGCAIGMSFWANECRIGVRSRSFRHMKNSVRRAMTDAVYVASVVDGMTCKGPWE